MGRLIFTSQNEKETKRVGQLMGKSVKPGQIILLYGDLGAGKTVFVKGLARGLEIEQKITSPTYVLINEYQGRLPLFHMDFYRLDDSSQLEDIGFADYLYRSGVTAVEWPTIAEEYIGQSFLKICFENKGSNSRKIVFRASGEQSEELAAVFSEELLDVLSEERLDIDESNGC